MKTIQKPSVANFVKKIKEECKSLNSSLPKSFEMFPLLALYFEEDHQCIVKCFSVSIVIFFLL